MSNNGAEFTPEQVEHQIARLTQTQPLWSDLSSDARLISELHQRYTEDDVIVENAWQRLAEQVKIIGPRSLAGNVTLQRRPRMGTLPEWQERPQNMNVNTVEKRRPTKIIRLLEICAAILVVIALVAGTALLLNSAHQTQTTGSKPIGSKVAATTTPTAPETPASTILFSDPLTQNIHNFLLDDQHFFKNGAYHIIDQSDNGAGMVVQQTFTSPNLSYQITMDEIAGDETTGANTFGVMLNYNVSTHKSSRMESFYVFEIRNEGANSHYGFYEYNSSRLAPWQQIGQSIKPGHEFHGGHGTNIIKVVEHTGSFTFYVNNQQVGTARVDSPLKTGSVGMLVNQKGTEVAFSNMLVTRP
ncbi:MAG TPA: hypothetical protein VGM01_04680 [Ktedonobacteraceae bacterium]|jgi:hypothetical protein